jgi:hypothetical protein
MSKEIITEVKVLPGVEVPQPVKDALLGSAEGGLQEKHRAEYFALVVFLPSDARGSRWAPRNRS